MQNGVGYDTFMNKIESASPNPTRKVIVAQHVLGLPDSTPNPHLWYDPKTMPAVAKAMAADLSALQPAHQAYFQANLKTFDESLAPWLNAIAQFKATYPGAPVATTEPVSDYLLQAMGIDNLTPFRFQADLMNGVDPSPQDIALQNSFFTQHKAKVFVYNQQVVERITTSIRQTALKAGVPVVGVYETMPTRLPATSRGWSPRSTPSRRRWPARSPPRSCDETGQHRDGTEASAAAPEVLRVAGVSVSLARAAESSMTSASPSAPGSSPA